MRLQRILDELVEAAPGATGAILADWEGEAVVTRSMNGGDYEIKVIGAHQGVILAEAREMFKRLRLGETTLITFALQNFNAVTAPINHEYYLVLTLRPEAIPGRARPAIRAALRELECEV